MKTWTNPTVEELEVKNTALFEIIDEIEWFNGKPDGSLIIGGGNTSNPGTPGEGGEGSEGTGSEDGDQGEGGLGTES